MKKNIINNEECEYGMCDGSGVITGGRDDDVENKVCPCSEKEEDEFDDRQAD